MAQQSFGFYAYGYPSDGNLNTGGLMGDSVYPATQTVGRGVGGAVVRGNYAGNSMQQVNAGPSSNQNLAHNRNQPNANPRASQQNNPASKKESFYCHVCDEPQHDAKTMHWHKMTIEHYNKTMEKKKLEENKQKEMREKRLQDELVGKTTFGLPDRPPWLANTQKKQNKPPWEQDNSMNQDQGNGWGQGQGRGQEQADNWGQPQTQPANNQNWGGGRGRGRGNEQQETKKQVGGMSWQRGGSLHVEDSKQEQSWNQGRPQDAGRGKQGLGWDDGSSPGFRQNQQQGPQQGNIQSWGNFGPNNKGSEQNMNQGWNNSGAHQGQQQWGQDQSYDNQLNQKWNQGGNQGPGNQQAQSHKQKKKRGRRGGKGQQGQAADSNTMWGQGSMNEGNNRMSLAQGVSPLDRIYQSQTSQQEANSAGWGTPGRLPPATPRAADPFTERMSDISPVGLGNTPFGQAKTGPISLFDVDVGVEGIETIRGRVQQMTASQRTTVEQQAMENKKHKQGRLEKEANYQRSLEKAKLKAENKEENARKHAEAFERKKKKELLEYQIQMALNANLPYDPELGAGRCLVCKEMNFVKTPELWQSHVSGKKHRTELIAYLSFLGVDGFCEEYGDFYIPFNNTDNVLQTLTSGLPMSQLDYLRSLHNLSKEEKKQYGKYLLKIAEHYKMYCVLCQSQSTNYASFHLHVTGKKHAAAVSYKLSLMGPLEYLNKYGHLPGPNLAHLNEEECEMVPESLHPGHQVFIKEQHKPFVMEESDSEEEGMVSLEKKPTAAKAKPAATAVKLPGNVAELLSNLVQGLQSSEVLEAPSAKAKPQPAKQNDVLGEEDMELDSDDEKPTVPRPANIPPLQLPKQPGLRPGPMFDQVRGTISALWPGQQPHSAQPQVTGPVPRAAFHPSPNVQLQPAMRQPGPSMPPPQQRMPYPDSGMRPGPQAPNRPPQLHPAANADVAQGVHPPGKMVDRVYASSRFRGEWLPPDVEMEIMQEATLDTLVDLALKFGRPHRAYFLFGEWDMNQRRQHDTYEEIVLNGGRPVVIERLSERIRAAVYKLDPHGIVPIFADIVPVIFHDWNFKLSPFAGQPYLQMQTDYNATLAAINIIIRDDNKKRGLEHVDLTSMMIIKEGENYLVKRELLVNGVHPVPDLINVAWRKAMTGSIVANRAQDQSARPPVPDQRKLPVAPAAAAHLKGQEEKLPLPPWERKKLEEKPVFEEDVLVGEWSGPPVSTGKVEPPHGRALDSHARPAEMVPPRRPAEMVPPRRPAEMQPQQRHPTEMQPPQRRPTEMVPQQRRTTEMPPQQRRPTEMPPPQRRPIEMEPPRQRPTEMGPPQHERSLDRVPERPQSDSDRKHTGPRSIDPFESRRSQRDTSREHYGQPERPSGSPELPGDLDPQMLLEELSGPLQEILNQMPGLPDATSLLQATAVLQALDTDMIALLTEPSFQRMLERLQKAFQVLEDPNCNKAAAKRELEEILDSPQFRDTNMRKVLNMLGFDELLTKFAPRYGNSSSRSNKERSRSSERHFSDRGSYHGGPGRDDRRGGEHWNGGPGMLGSPPRESLPFNQGGHSGGGQWGPGQAGLRVNTGRDSNPGRDRQREGGRDSRSSRVEWRGGGAESSGAGRQERNSRHQDSDRSSSSRSGTRPGGLSGRPAEKRSGADRSSGPYSKYSRR